MGVFSLLWTSIWSGYQVWVSVVLCVVAVWYIKRRRYNLPPRPYSWPIVGNFFSLPKDYLYVWCQEVSRTHGPVFRISMGLTDAVVINDVKNAHAALVDNSADFSGRLKSIAMELGTQGYQDVAIADPDPMWSKRRKLLATSTRNFSSGRNYEKTTFESLQKLSYFLDEKVDMNESFDPKEHLRLFIYNQMARICFSKTYNIDDSEFKDLVQKLEASNDLLAGVFLTDLVPFLRYLPFQTPDQRYITDVCQPLNDMVLREIQHHRATATQTDTTDLTYHVLKMIQDDKSLLITDVQLEQLILDVFSAGVDTTHLSLRWIVLCLAAFPDLQSNVYDEIIQIVGPMNINDDFQGVSGIDYKQKMPYTEAFLLECIRFGTVAPFGLPRRTLCDTKIGEYDIPKDTDVFINQYAINYDEKENKNPHEFNPGRFLSDGRIGPRPTSFMPFGAGRRSCPGETAARSTLWLTLVFMVRRYKILPPLDDNGDHVNMLVKYDGNSFGGTPIDYKIRLEYRQ